MNSFPLATQRLIAQIMTSPRRSFTAQLAAMLGRVKIPRREELAELRPITRLLIVGLMGWIGFVGLATLIAVASVEFSTISYPAWLSAGAAASPGIENGSPAGFENILRRPLFSRNRQGASATVEVATPPSLPAMLDQNITLKGVFINGALAKAFLTSTQNPLGVWVQADEEIAGWRVVAVNSEKVLLDAPNEKLIVELSVNGSSK